MAAGVGTVVVLESEEEFDAVVESTKGGGRPAVINCGASWCGNCKLLAPKWKKAAAARPGLALFKADVSEHEDLNEALEVSKLPSFVFVKDGKVVETYAGSAWPQIEKRLDALQVATAEAAEVESPAAPSGATEAPASASASASVSAAGSAAPTAVKRERSEDAAMLPKAPAVVAPKGIVQLATEEELDAAIQSGSGLTVVNCGAGWCGQCRRLKPKYNNVSKDAKWSHVLFAKVDVSESEELQERLAVPSLPAFLFYKNGEQVGSYVGSNWSTVLEKLEQFGGKSTGDDEVTKEESEDTASAPKRARHESSAATGSAGAGASTQPPRDVDVLNVASFPGGIALASGGAKVVAASAEEVAVSLNRKIMSTLSQFIRDDGTGVDYKGMAASSAFVDYVQETEKLQHVRLQSLAELAADTQLAFWLNLYNALTIHGNVVVGPPDASVKGAIGKFFASVSYQIGGSVMSLDDIEHGVLRCNQLHPTRGEKFFATTDPRRVLVRKVLDPRIHFALVCGAKSCPPIRIFTPKNVNRALDAASRNFLRDNLKLEGDTVQTSKILDWYGKDFADTAAGILRWAARKLQGGDAEDVELATELEALLTRQPAPTLTFAEYNWSTNHA